MVTKNSIDSDDPIEVAKGGTGRATHTAYAVVCGGTTTTAAQQSIAGVGTSGQILTSNGAAALPTFQAAAGGGGVTLQQVRTSTSALFDVGTAIPYDDTIPQQTEGDEILTLAITPIADDSVLFVEASITGNVDSTSRECSAAIFRDATAGAIAAAEIGRTASGDSTDDAIFGSIRVWVTSGSTDETTFKLRCGSETTSGMSINGDGASRLYGGVSSTTLTVTEYSA